MPSRHRGRQLGQLSPCAKTVRTTICNQAFQGTFCFRYAALVGRSCSPLKSRRILARDNPSELLHPLGESHVHNERSGEKGLPRREQGCHQLLEQGMLQDQMVMSPSKNRCTWPTCRA
eukprot:1143328-Pelagomonas_calceolata.AAC.1